MTNLTTTGMYVGMMTAERAGKCKRVADLFGGGMSIADACKEVGMAERTWYRLRGDQPRVEMWYANALKRRADKVANAVYESAVGLSKKRRAEFVIVDGERTLRTEIEETLPPDIQAAKYYLNNVAPEDWADKQVIEHGLTAEAEASQRAIRMATEVIDVSAT